MNKKLREKKIFGDILTSNKNGDDIVKKFSIKKEKERNRIREKSYLV